MLSSFICFVKILINTKEKLLVVFQLEKLITATAQNCRHTISDSSLFSGVLHPVMLPYFMAVLTPCKTLPLQLFDTCKQEQLNIMAFYKNRNASGIVKYCF